MGSTTHRHAALGVLCGRGSRQRQDRRWWYPVVPLPLPNGLRGDIPRCRKSPPALFSRRSEAQHTAQSTIRLFARCGLARGTVRLGAPGWAGENKGHCEHPVWLYGVVSHIEICAGFRSPCELSRSLLAVHDRHIHIRENHLMMTELGRQGNICRQLRW